MNGKNQAAKGFTLVELITVTAMIMIITIFSAVNYRASEQRLVLDNQAAQFMQDIRRAREWALSARQFDGVSPYGYGVHVAAGNQYYLYADLNNNRQWDSGETRETVTLDSRISVVACEPCNTEGMSINYIAPDLLARIVKHDTASAPDWGKIVFALKADPSKIRTVCLNIAGLVYALDSGDDCLGD